MIFWVKYGTQSDIRFPMVKRGVVDLAVGADWTPAAADSAISKDGGSYADTTNTVAVLTGTSTRTVAAWKLTISATEAQAAELNVQIVDAATKAVEDQFLTVYTYGNASAKFAGDWSDIVRMGLTAFPNVASGSAGAIPTTGTGANQISVSSGQVILQAGTAAGQLDFTSGVVKANAVQLLGTAWLTPGTAGTPDVNAKQIGGTAQTGLDLGANWTAARAAHLDADISSRMATFSLPANFAATSISVGGVVAASGNWSIAGDAMTLTAAYNAAKTASQAGDAMALTGGERTSLAGVINTTAITESYRANGAAPTPAQVYCEILAHLGESSITGTTKTAKKFDHSTTAATYTLDSATTPAAITRAT